MREEIDCVAAEGTDLLLIERHYDGHRLFYIRLLVEYASRRDMSITLMLSDGAERRVEFVQQLLPLRSQFQLISTAKLALKDLEDASRKISARNVVIPDGDAIATRLALRGGWKGSGRVTTLVMRERATSLSRLPGASALKMATKSALIFLGSKSRRVRIVILKSPVWSGKSPYVTVVDPVAISCSEVDIDSIRAKLNLDPDTVWFGVVGRINAGKRIDLIVRAISRLEKGNYGLAIVGKTTSESDGLLRDVKIFAREHGIRVKHLGSFLSDGELDAALTVVDYNVIVRSNESPSGILGKTLALGLKSVVAGTQQLKQYSLRFPNNVFWSELSEIHLERALFACMGSDKPPQILGRDGGSFASVLVDD